MKDIIKKAAEKLLPEIPELYTPEGEQSEQSSYQKRKVHEITINHQLAHYLKLELDSRGNHSNSVDIEFNKDGTNDKQSENVNGTLGNVRPDIIVHKRKKDNFQGENLLVIECKKSTEGKAANTRDKNKVERMMRSPLNYRHGAMVVYYTNKIEINYKESRNVDWDIVVVEVRPQQPR